MTEKNALTIAMEKHKITVSAVFIPYSKSRNAEQKDERGNPRYSLNWKVTLLRDGKPVIETDYSAGEGHCPSYNKKAPAAWKRPARFWRDAVCEWECENGFEAVLKPFFSDFTRKQKPRSDADIDAGRPRVFFPIEPKPQDVVFALILDSSVLNYRNYAEWAADFGYNPDSISGEKLYRDCLEIALSIRSGLGETIMAELSEAAQDY